MRQLTHLPLWEGVGEKERARDVVIVLEHKQILFSEKTKSIGLKPIPYLQEDKESLDLLS